jgi:hypothetical protein
VIDSRLIAKVLHGLRPFLHGTIVLGEQVVIMKACHCEIISPRFQAVLCCSILGPNRVVCMESAGVAGSAAICSLKAA